ncbi:hypothetical protein [Xanthomonas vasicola]|uniref:Membrane protein n=2 Tax=Xanthomonas vasicola TaxID=56459 RepID=A0A837B5W9_XANVA|nr:hypothetical protein [Xanthomonas vasicola]KFA31007.1 membrane protein [Xanthomonas vasicola pv. musacearum NCPPB 4384]MBV6747406.1 hypothetical protein [Xanthomonas vasicola pv. vasculorum NCPPB 890]MBV6892992.1 hypothetical protein [Xanthomonas vasicola pv. vasculorum]KFA07083.1 membrane protein [Xanthomonas vasicola pv. musacearum NCPPB 4380]KFA12662.1 membrane protein [Xanthomonas vasicola pv. musacearum NCPPB 2005]
MPTDMGSPDVTAILLTLVTSLLSRVPMLIAVLLGLVLLWRAPQSPLRRAGLAALWLLLGCLFAEVAFQAIPMLLLQQGNVRQISMVVSIAHFVLMAVQAVGIGVLVWTLAASLQRLAPATGPRS